MRIDEFEFQDKNGNEIEPTKNQLVIYIKSLHKQIQDLKETQKQLAINELKKVKQLLDEYKWFQGENEYSFVDDYAVDWTDINEIIDKQIENLKGK